MELTKFEDIYKNEDVIKITKKASAKFHETLSQDEIHTCIINAIWKCINKYNKELGTKFTTYLYKGVILECLTQQKFNRSYVYTAQVHSNIPETGNTGSEVDILDELRVCEDPTIIYDRFFKKKTIKEIARERGVCGETIRLKIKKNLSNLKKSMTLSV